MDIQEIVSKLKDEADYQDLMIIPHQETLENERQMGVKEGLRRSIYIIEAILKNGKEKQH